MERALNKRNYSRDDLLDLLNTYDRLTDREKDVLASAVSVFHAIFDKNPDQFEFDFRFNRR